MTNFQFAMSRGGDFLIYTGCIIGVTAGAIATAPSVAGTVAAFSGLGVCYGGFVKALADARKAESAGGPQDGGARPTGGGRVGPPPGAGFGGGQQGGGGGHQGGGGGQQGGGGGGVIRQH